MKTTQLLAIGVILAGGVSAPLLSQGGSDAALERACRATEVTSPQSCPCTITAARNAGISDAQMASLFKDDGHSSPVPGQTYTRFWQAKSKCLSEAMLAQLGVTPGNPLPGVPTNMQPGNIPGAIPNVPQMAPPPAPVTRQPPTQIARQAPVPQASSPRRDLQSTNTRRDLVPAQNRAAAAASGRLPWPGDPSAVYPTRAQVFDTAWIFDNNWSLGHRVDFRPDGFMVSSDRDGRVRSVGKYSFDEKGQLQVTNNSVIGRYGAAAFPIAPDGRLYVYYKGTARGAEEVFFARKVGKANRGWSKDGIAPLGSSGFWSIPFLEQVRRAKPQDPMLEERVRLANKFAVANLQDPRPPKDRYSSMAAWRFTGRGEGISLMVSGTDRKMRPALEFPGATRLYMRENEAGDAFELLATGGGRSEFIRCTGRSFAVGGGRCEKVAPNELAFGPVPQGFGSAAQNEGRGAYTNTALANRALAQRLGTVTMQSPGWTLGADCGSVIYGFDELIDPRSYADANRLIETKGRMIYRSDGMLGEQDSFITGIILDGRFTKLTQVQGTGVWRDASGRVEVEEADKGVDLEANPAASMETLVFVLRVDGEEARIPAISSGAC